MCSGRERSAKKLQYRAASRSAQSYQGQASTVPEESSIPEGLHLLCLEGWASVRRMGMLELSVRTRMDEGRRPHARALSVTCIPIPTSTSPGQFHPFPWLLFQDTAAFSSPVFS